MQAMSEGHTLNYTRFTARGARGSILGLLEA